MLVFLSPPNSQQPTLTVFWDTEPYSVEDTYRHFTEIAASVIRYVNTAYTVRTIHTYEKSKSGQRSGQPNKGNKMQKIKIGMWEDPLVSEDEEKSLPNSLTFFHCILNSPS